MWSNTEVQYIWEANVGHIWTAQQNALAGSLCVAPEATASAEGAPSGALSSVKRQAVATQMVEWI